MKSTFGTDPPTTHESQTQKLYPIITSMLSLYIRPFMQSIMLCGLKLYKDA